jgi:iron complex transport system substrate-binding protein
VNRVAGLNLIVLLVAIAATLALAWPRATPSAKGAVSRSDQPANLPVKTRLESGELAIADASGSLVPLRRYHRIVSTNLVTDRLLIELCDPSRIRAISRAAAERKLDGYRYRGLDIVDGFGPIEAMLALKPDLVLMNSFGAPGSAQRLRSAGVEVFDLGQLHGESSLAHVALSLGELLGEPERARRFIDSLEGRMKRASAGLGSRPHKRAVFLSILGPDLQCGTRGTSYHDIMVAAGLEDVAARDYHGWPALSAEQVLALAPDIVVTRAGAAERVCRYPGMEHLAPCRGEGRIVELPGELLDEPGPSMLDAAELLFALVYGSE